MKKDIHPNYMDCVITCACGNVINTRSTVPKIHVEICSACHPFYTGKQKLVDTAGRIERFRRRYEKKEPPKKEPLAKAVCVRMFQECLKRGMVSMVYNPHFRINPPLSIDADAADECMGILDEVFALISREDAWR